MKFKVTYHLINGENKTICYGNPNNLPKDRFLNQILGWKDGSFLFYSDEQIKNIVNINYVCFMEIEEIEKLTAEEMSNKILSSHGDTNG